MNFYECFYAKIGFMYMKTKYSPKNICMVT